MVFQVKYLALFLFLPVIDGFGLFWMGRLHKNIQVKTEFLKGSFLVLHFSYYTWMAFLMMLFVILLSILMMLLFALNVNTAILSDDTILFMLNVIRHLVCAVATTRIAASELESDLQDTGLEQEEACWFQCWKNSNSFCFTCPMTLVLLMWKWMGLFLRKNHSFRCCGWLSLPNWIEAHTLPLLLKLFPRKLEL